MSRGCCLRFIRHSFVLAQASLVIFLAVSAPRVTLAGRDTSINKLANEFYERRAKRERTPSLSKPATRSWIAALRRFETSLERINLRTLTDQGRMTWRLLRVDIERQRAHYEQKHLVDDLSLASVGTVISPIEMHSWLEDNQWRPIFKTLRNAGRWSATYIERLREGMKSGRTVPREVVDTAIKRLFLLSRPHRTKNPFRGLYATLDAQLEHAHGTKRDVLRRRRKELESVVENIVIPAHKELRTFLLTKYRKKTKPLEEVPHRFFYWMRHFFGPHERPPNEVAQTCRDMIAKTRKKLVELARELYVTPPQGYTEPVGTAGSFRHPETKHVWRKPRSIPASPEKLLVAFSTRLRDRKEEQYQDFPDLLADAERQVARAQRHMIFPKGARFPVREMREPDRRDFPALCMTVDDPLECTVFFSSFYEDTWRRFDIYNVIRHELGHAEAQMFTHRMASRHKWPHGRTIANFPAFEEGWAVDSQWQSYRRGELTRLEQFAFLEDLLSMEAQALVDIEYNLGRMNRKQAIRFLHRQGLMDLEEVPDLVDGLANSPGEATAYVLGAWRVHALRQSVRNIMGRHYREEHFTRGVLNYGSVPLYLLEPAVEAWAQRKKQSLERKARTAPRRSTPPRRPPQDRRPFVNIDGRPRKTG